MMKKFFNLPILVKLMIAGIGSTVILATVLFYLVSIHGVKQANPIRSKIDQLLCL